MLLEKNKTLQFIFLLFVQPTRIKLGSSCVPSAVEIIALSEVKSPLVAIKYFGIEISSARSCAIIGISFPMRFRGFPESRVRFLHVCNIFMLSTVCDKQVQSCDFLSSPRITSECQHSSVEEPSTVIFATTNDRSVSYATIFTP